MLCYIAPVSSQNSGEMCDSKGGWVAIGPEGSVFVCPYTTGVEDCRYKCPPQQ